MNDDPTDDCPTNLQILTPYENTLKEHIRRKGTLQTQTPQTCPVCSKVFYDHRVLKSCGDVTCVNELRSRTANGRLRVAEAEIKALRRENEILREERQLRS